MAAHSMTWLFGNQAAGLSSPAAARCTLASRLVNGLAMFGKRLTRGLGAGVLALTLVVGAGATTRAHAQFGMMNGAQAMPEAITRRGFDAYTRILGLDADQKEAAKALYEGHQAAFRALQKDIQDKMAALGEKARDSGDFSVYQKDMPAMMKEITSKAEGLEEGFFTDLKSVCTEPQLANWDAVTRYHRREKAMRFGFVSGSAVDLVSVMEKLKITPASPGEAKETLLAYELEVDKLLVEFERMGKDAQKDMFDAGAMFDMKRVEEMMKKFYDSASSVRDVNRNYARRLESSLTEDDKLKFAAEIKRRSFPRIYKTSHPQQLFAAANGFADLTKDQKEQLVAAQETYERELSGVNERWAKATEEKEAKAGGSIMVMIQSFQGMGGGDPEDPVKLARAARKELDDKTKERIESVLTAEQKSKLPAKKAEGFNPMADFMPVEDESEGDTKE
jgi:hypothetical protein